MSVRLQVGDPAVLTGGVPDGLVALRLDTVVVDEDGNARVQNDRRGRTRIDRVLLRAANPTGRLPDNHPHGPVRRALDASSRKRTGPRGVAPADLGVVLARAGLVDLHTEVTLGSDGLHARPWNRWERTDLGSGWADTYTDAPEGDAGRFAVAEADEHTGGTADDWLELATTTAADTLRMLHTAQELVTDGTAVGWSLSRFARRVCGATHTLDAGSRLAPLVLRHLARQLDLEVDPTTAEGRAEVFAAADLGVDMLASWVACSRVPPGEGPAAELLQVGAAYDMPVTIPRVALHDGRPVASPPAAGGWVFAVENEGALTEAHRLRSDAPVVWHGSTAAVLLLQAAADVGWRVAVSGDFEPGGLRRAAWLLDRLGDSAVPWRLTVNDYRDAVAAGAGVADLPARFTLPDLFDELRKPMQTAGQRITEEARLQWLLDDVAKGAPWQA